MINRFDVFVTSIATQCCEDKAAISCTIAELTGRGLITCEQKKYRAPLLLTDKENLEAYLKG